MEDDRVPDTFASHVLVVDDASHAADGVAIHNGALAAVLDRADAVDLCADAALVADEYPSVAAAIRDAFERVGNDRYRGTLPDCRPALESLLATEGIYRFVGLERLDVRTDGDLLARYVPDHSKFRIDCTAVDGLHEALDRRLEDYPAAILPARTLAEWRCDGTRYELRPPSLCGDRLCVGLSGITHVRLGDAERRIELEWRRPSGLLQRAVDRLFPDAPRAFAIDDAEQYREAADAFALVAQRLAVPVERSPA